ncbi:hypothetical protein BC628DRAFT_1369607 [Trametes gibbosa]|nr:hypothetical protein BC628DRAFT_1369607 [Trametes gibbosa]
MISNGRFDIALLHINHCTGVPVSSDLFTFHRTPFAYDPNLKGGSLATSGSTLALGAGAPSPARNTLAVWHIANHRSPTTVLIVEDGIASVAFSLAREIRSRSRVYIVCACSCSCLCVCASSTAHTRDATVRTHACPRRRADRLAQRTRPFNNNNNFFPQNKTSPNVVRWVITISHVGAQKRARAPEGGGMCVCVQCALSWPQQREVCFRQRH